MQSVDTIFCCYYYSCKYDRNYCKFISMQFERRNDNTKCNSFQLRCNVVDRRSSTNIHAIYLFFFCSVACCWIVWTRRRRKLKWIRCTRVFKLLVYFCCLVFGSLTMRTLYRYDFLGWVVYWSGSAQIFYLLLSERRCVLSKRITVFYIFNLKLLDWEFFLQRKSIWLMQWHTFLKWKDSVWIRL